jgi:streptogramin lyase
MILAASAAPAAQAAYGPRDYIVVLDPSVEHPGNVAHAQLQVHHGDMTGFYRHAIEGYAATLPPAQVDSLRNDPRVAFVTIDHPVQVLEGEFQLENEANGGFEVSEPTVPTGIKRTFATSNKALKINGEDDLRVDADVAVIDTGIDYQNPDLSVGSRTDCHTGTCVENSGTDGSSHGTHVAGTIAAIDNNLGVVGMAPGARLWAVKVLGDGGSGSESAVIAGVDWVTAHASQIEVANMSLGSFYEMPALETAVTTSIESGVVYAVAAGNWNADAKYISPAKNPNVITVSALADYDGLPGSKSAPTCDSYGTDDQKASFSDYGPLVDVVAPGTCILSTVPGSKYALYSGTSMATPHVAGAAAILASQKNPSNKAEVEAIRSTIVTAGNKGWTDTSGDGIQEPLLDVSNETTFKPVAAPPPPAPENTALPTVSPSSPLEALPETATTGTWKNGVTGYAYQWRRCNASGGECVDISGATGTTYTPVTADVAHSLVVKVTATNGGGSASASSAATQTVKPVGEVTEYVIPTSGSTPAGITSGPDGNLWFAEGGKNKVGKVTTGGSFTEFALSGWPTGIAKGPDGNLWSANASGSVSKITTAGSITTFPFEYANATGIAKGPDGNLWFTVTSGKIGKITTAGSTTFYTTPSGSLPIGIAAGSDGKLWYTNQESSKIAKITTSGTITEYALPAGRAPTGITAGPDGNLWFTCKYGNKIGRITTSGTITEYSLPAGSWPEGITAGPDGNLWFTNYQTNKIGRITTAGVITEFTLTSGSKPAGITTGPDNRVWFSEEGRGRIGAIVP